MARLLKTPVKKRTLKGLRRGRPIHYGEQTAPGKKDDRMLSKRDDS